MYVSAKVHANDELTNTVAEKSQQAYLTAITMVIHTNKLGIDLVFHFLLFLPNKMTLSPEYIYKKILNHRILVGQ